MTPAPLTSRGARVLTGDVRYVADISGPADLHLVVVRSREPHARISIDIEQAQAVPGVRAVLTGADVRSVTEPMGMMWNAPVQASAPTWCLARDRVRYVGEPIAAVVADDPYLAEDAAELVQVDYAPLPVAVDPAPDGPRLYDDWPDNVFGRTRFEVGDIQAGIDDAAVVITGSYTSERMFGLPLETRGCRAEWSGDGQALTLDVSTQSPNQVRESLAHTLRTDLHRIRVRCGDVGGAFGNKACAYVEETLVAFAARALGRPVRWIESRTESFVATVHGRGITVDLELGLASDGTITALRGQVLLDCGATPYMVGLGTGIVAAGMLYGPYRVPNALTELVAVVTNKTPIGAFRGYGMPEATFAIERALDEGARRLGMDPIEIRRRNMLDPDELPHWTPAMLYLDSGRYRQLLDDVAEHIDWDRTKADVARARAEGRLVGVGVASYLEATNFGPSLTSAMMGIANPGHDRAVVRMDNTGGVTVLTGQMPMGQGLDEALAKVAAAEIGVPQESVELVYGDTLACPYTGYGSGGSRGAGVAGSAVQGAARRMRDRLRALATHMLAADGAEAVHDVADGFADQSDGTVTVAEVAGAAYLAADLPDGTEPGLETSLTYEPESFGFSYGSVAAVVEIDRITGAVDVQRLVFGHDCGPQLDPDLVAAQVVGGVAQGIGTALYEHLPYSEDGRPAVETLWHYRPPLLANVPEVELLHLETPSPFTLNGAKGAGESGVIPIPAVIANAIRDALGYGSPVTDTVPITAERLLETIERGPTGDVHIPRTAQPVG